MSPFAHLNAVLARIASATSIARTQQEDESRLDAHGGTLDEIIVRVSEVASRFEQVATRLEAQV